MSIVRSEGQDDSGILLCLSKSSNMGRAPGQPAKLSIKERIRNGLRLPCNA